ncbi:MAG TPA: DUF4363 family protein [Bacillota bacterium]|nr:DUF4363 family protein [Bacillota bacterium]
MKKIFFKLLPIVVIGLFILVMTTGAFLKKPLTGDDDVIHHIDNVQNSIHEDQWEKANEQLTQAEQAWKKIISRIQYSAERDEINTISKNIERARGYIDVQDKAGTLSELAEARFIWEELGK